MFREENKNVDGKYERRVEVERTRVGWLNRTFESRQQHKAGSRLLERVTPKSSDDESSTICRNSVLAMHPCLPLYVCHGRREFVKCPLSSPTLSLPLRPNLTLLPPCLPSLSLFPSVCPFLGMVVSKHSLFTAYLTLCISFFFQFFVVLTLSSSY